MRIALQISYDGRAGAGWQTQPGAIAIQDQVESALTQIAGHPVATVCAGRTDAGVHAVSQLVHFDTVAQRPAQAWVRGVNALLSSLVAVQAGAPVADDFHARFCARRRRYHYLLMRSRTRTPLLHGKVTWLHQPLDLAAMTQAAQALIGTHDFSAFRSAQCQAASPVRTIESIAITEHGPLVALEVVANAFLHHMIRNMVGSLFEVASGRKPMDWLVQVLASRDRRNAARTFDADGLYLTGVDYEQAIAGLNLWPQPPAGGLWY